MAASQDTNTVSYNVAAAQPYLDSLLGKLEVQMLLTGIYINIFIQTLLPIIRQGRRKIYTANLFALFCAIVINLGASYSIIEAAFIDDNNTQGSIATDALTGTPTATIIANSSSLVAIFTGDIILISRCYIICARHKGLLALFLFLLLGQFAIIVAETVPSVKPNDQFPLTIPIFYFVSLAITILATLVIILRITYISRRSGRESSRYAYTMEILFESGGLYAASLIITSALMIASPNNLTVDNGPVTQAKVYWEGIMLPMTGIAPTLIAFRVATGRARDDSSWSQQVSANSTIRFTRPPGNAISTDHIGRSTAVSNTT